MRSLSHSAVSLGCLNPSEVPFKIKTQNWKYSKCQVACMGRETELTLQFEDPYPRDNESQTDREERPGATRNLLEDLNESSSICQGFRGGEGG